MGILDTVTAMHEKKFWKGTLSVTVVPILAFPRTGQLTNKIIDKQLFMQQYLESICVSNKTIFLCQSLIIFFFLQTGLVNNVSKF